MELKNPDIRKLSDMKEVLCNQEWAKTAEDKDLYYMYRDIKRDGKLRYDVTIIPPFSLGGEFVKTKGHYHPDNYGELYIVLEGKAFFLFQKMKSPNEIEDIYAIEGKKGDHIIVPPEYGHITINHGEKDLKMANWVMDDFESDYQPILEKKGAGYFLTNEGWIKNKNYEIVPNLYFKEPEKSMPKDLSFLGDDKK